jgi:hypothetical protein
MARAIMPIEKPLSPRSPRFLTLFRIDKHIERQLLFIVKA